MGNHQSNSHPVKRRTHPQKTPPPSSASSSSSPSSTPAPQNPSLPPLKNQAFLPNRASYYIPRSETEKLPNSPINLKASDTHFPIDTPRKSNTIIRPKTPSKPSTKLVTSDQKSRDSQGFELPPILTKPTKIETGPTVRRSPVGLHRLRLRTSSPRLQSKKLESFRARRSSWSKQRKPGLSASFAVVKSSLDPKRDFRDSMMEMIVEHKIRASKDLEELLACYLALNSDEYHGVIVKVFKQIWFELTEVNRL